MKRGVLAPASGNARPRGEVMSLDEFEALKKKEEKSSTSQRCWPEGHSCRSAQRPTQLARSLARCVRAASCRAYLCLMLGSSLRFSETLVCRALAEKEQSLSDVDVSGFDFVLDDDDDDDARTARNRSISATPGKAQRTPGKAKITARTPGKSLIEPRKTPGKTPGKRAAKNSGESTAKTPSKGSKTPRAKTPGAKSTKTPGKKNIIQPRKTPGKSVRKPQKMDLERTSSASSFSSTSSSGSSNVTTARAIEEARKQKLAKMKEDRRKKEQRQAEQERLAKEFAAQQDQEKQADTMRQQQMRQLLEEEGHTIDAAQAAEAADAGDSLMDMDDDPSGLSDHTSFGTWPSHLSVHIIS